MEAVCSLFWNGRQQPSQHRMEQTVALGEAELAGAYPCRARRQAHTSAHEAVCDHGNQQLLFNGGSTFSPQVMQADRLFQSAQIQLQVPPFSIATHNQL